MLFRQKRLQELKQYAIHKGDMVLEANQSLTDKAQLVGAFVGKRLEDNLAAFKEHMPHVYDAFKDYREKKFYLTIDSDGSINVFNTDKDEFVYSDNAVQQVLDNYAEYQKSPVYKTALCIGAGKREFGDQTDCVSYQHSSVMARIGDIQFDLVCKKSRELAENYIAGKKTDFALHEMPDDINCLFSISTGVGFDLEKMYLEKNIRHLFLLEPDMDIFYVSLQLMDWKSILEKSINEERYLYIGMSEDNKELISDFLHELMQCGRHSAAAAYIYSPFYQDGYEEIFEVLKSDLESRVFTGYGFYDDSRVALAHTIKNVFNGVPCIKVDRSVNKIFGQSEYPCFIVGNGPSLDNDIEFIKNNKNKAVVVSCGTALNTLLKNGIVPDFHAELERTAHVTHILKRAVKQYKDTGFFKKTRFIGMSQVHHGVFDLFDKKGMFPKDSETGSTLLRYALPELGVPLVGHCAPSCTHTAVSTAVILGFRQFYFFGVDMGYRSADQHHSKDSIYSEVNDDMQAFYKPAESSDIEFEANFGDDPVYSSGFLPMFKSSLETIVKTWNTAFTDKISFSNCSDGAKISGAEPLHSNELHFNDDLEDKDEILDDIMSSHFSSIDESSFSEIDKAVEKSKETVSFLASWLKDNIGAVETVAEGREVIDKIAYKFHDDSLIEDDLSWAYSVFDGSLLYWLGAINNILYMPIEEEYRLESFNKAMIVLQDAMDEIDDDFSLNCLTTDDDENYSYF